MWASAHKTMSTCQSSDCPRDSPSCNTQFEYGIHFGLKQSFPWNKQNIQSYFFNVALCFCLFNVVDSVGHASQSFFIFIFFSASAFSPTSFNYVIKFPFLSFFWWVQFQCSELGGEEVDCRTALAKLSLVVHLGPSYYARSQVQSKYTYPLGEITSWQLQNKSCQAGT